MWSLLTGYKLVKDMSWGVWREFYIPNWEILHAAIADSYKISKRAKSSLNLSEDLDSIIPACQKWSSD